MIGMKSAADIKEPKGADQLPLQEVGRVLLAVIGGVLLVLLLVAGYRFYHLSPQGLYKQAFVAYKLPNEGDYQLGATRVETAYRAGAYDSVIRESKKVQGFTDHDFLLIGLAYMHKGDFSAAIEPLRLVNLWNESDYKEEGEYYLALAYLRNMDYDKSLELMQQIRHDPDHTYYNQITDKLVRNVRILKWR
jgi:tetratricopeptide (TPR) repeat protein